MKTKTIYTIISFLTVVTFLGFSQHETTITERSKKVVVTYKLEKEVVTYSFPIATEYNEVNTLQHVARIESITKSTITIKHSKHKIAVTFDPEKVKGDDLDNLLRGLIVLHGFQTYELSN